MLKVGIIVSRFNEFITSKLLEGAKRAFEESNVEYEVFYVPGAFEIPVVAKLIYQKFDAVLTLGCVIKGETYHFDLVIKGVTEGITKVAVETGTPIIFGVLAVENVNQAIDRAGGKYGNKGYEWAKDAIEMAMLKHKITSEQK